MSGKRNAPLKRGWTTGACATGATRAAYTALLTGSFPDPVSVPLPRGRAPCFALARESLADGAATAGIVKDAGDDPDVTHGALVMATVYRATPGTGVTFRAGPGVGTVRLPGLKLAVGEPAINPAPRRMMRDAVAELATRHGDSGDVEIEISVAGGEGLAARTWNPRLGIEGGLSILGTTGVVVPFSCSAWIESIRQGIDVARAAGETHLAGCTGSVSAAAVRTLYGLPELAMIDMGDFVGGLLKHLRRHPVARLTIGGGIGKLSKLADGHMDLHSGRSQVDVAGLAERLQALGAEPGLVSEAAAAPSASAVLALAAAAGLDLAHAIAADAREAARSVAGNKTQMDVVVVDRDGSIIGRSDVR